MRPILKKGVGFRRLFDEGVALVAETSKVNVLNEAGCRFLELSDGTSTVEQILVQLAEEYDASEEVVRRDVGIFVQQAIEAGLIAMEPPTADR